MSEEINGNSTEVQDKMDRKSETASDISGEVSPEEATRFKAVENLKEFFPDLESQRLLRITPHGAFISEELIRQIPQKYLDWLKSTDSVVGSITEKKVMLKLFQSDEPERHYLVEGKSCLVGSLIRCKIQEPQKYKLDYYLGTPLSTEDYLHPADPLFARFKGVEAERTVDGVTIRVAVGRRSYLLTDNLLKVFRELALSSPKILRRYPEAAHSLRGALSAFVKVLNRVQYVKRGELLLIPARCKCANECVILRLGTFVIAANSEREIKLLYELEGKNFYKLVRDECALLFADGRNRKVDSLEILPRKHRFPAVIKAHGNSYFVNVQAIKHVADRIVFSASLHRTFSGHYTVGDCLKYLSAQFERATPIERRMISRHVERFKDPALKFWIFERWLFVVSRDNVILFTVDKTETGERRSKGPGRSGQGKRSRNNKPPA
jgi:hypothetical protein